MTKLDNAIPDWAFDSESGQAMQDAIQDVYDSIDEAKAVQVSNLPTKEEFKDFKWELDMASAELTSFVDSNHSVSELDRVDESNELLNNALYENCKGSEMSFLEKLEKFYKEESEVQDA